MTAARRLPYLAAPHHVSRAVGMPLPRPKDEHRAHAFMALCKAKAWEFHRGRLARFLTREDLIGIAMEAVCKAWLKWDKDRGATFETYAHTAIVHALVQEKLRYGRLSRTGITRSLSLSEDEQDDTEYELAGHTPTPEQIVSDAQLRDFVEKLPHPFARVVTRHFTDESLSDVGAELDLSRERIRQIEWQGLRMLEKRMLTKAERRQRRG